MIRHRYTVLMPDLFHGDPVPLNSDMATFSIPTWMQGVYGAKKVPHIPSSVDPIVETCINTLREKYNCKVWPSYAQCVILTSITESSVGGILFRRQICGSIPDLGFGQCRLHCAPSND